MPKFDGKVALITGGARGQGRNHAVALARLGADIVLCDSVSQVATVPYPMGVQAELDETIRMVEKLDRRCLAFPADVRDTDQMSQVVDGAIAELGRVDILLANAGIWSSSNVGEMTDDMWDDMIDINLTGVFKSIRAVIPHMISQNYGRIVVTSSMSGRRGFPGMSHYVASKWGVIGLVKSLALEVAGSGITANAICPTNVDTPLIQNEAFYRLFAPGVDNPGREDLARAFTPFNAIPIPWVEMDDITNAVIFFASDDARYVTGSNLEVAAGMNAANTA
jgi:SDR family mycofactocin-dependent oxidoreductase